MLVPEVRFNLGELFFFFFPHKLAAYVLLFITISLLTPSFGTLHTFKYSYLGLLTPPPLTHARCKSQIYLADLQKNFSWPGRQGKTQQYSSTGGGRLPGASNFCPSSVVIVGNSSGLICTSLRMDAHSISGMRLTFSNPEQHSPC